MLNLIERCGWQRLLNKYDPAGDGHVSFEDFVQYVIDHEKALRLSFESLDHKGDGTLQKFLFSWSVDCFQFYFFVWLSFIAIVFQGVSLADICHFTQKCTTCDEW